MKYIPDAIVQVAAALIAIPIFILIVICLWIRKISSRRER